ncbi:MAG: chaperone NapD [Rhizobiales bacterium]|nr:chaperone NapD [Hyphomicrobiales bacterium]
MNVCGVAVHVRPGARDGVLAALATLPGVEICAESDGGRLAVTVIDTDATMAIDQIAEIHRTPGVVAAALVYAQVDEAQVDDAKISDARLAPGDEDPHPRADGAPHRIDTQGLSS